MITPLLKSALEPVVARHRRLRSLYARAICWWLGSSVVAVLLLNGSSRFHALLAALATMAVARIASGRLVRGWSPDYRQIARAIEDRHPELHALLRTAVEQQPDPHTGQLHFLQQRVISEAVAQSRQHQWLDSIPTPRWIAAGAAYALGLAAMAATFFFVTPRAMAPLAEHDPVPDPVTVTPGDAGIEKGSGLVVLAKFHREVPSEAVLVLQPKNEPAQRIPLVRNLADPVFGGGIPEIDADLLYRVEYAGHATHDFQVRVFEHPRLERADATLRFPEYTRLPEKKIPDTHRVSAVEGTRLGVVFQLNKPVKSAALLAKDGTRLPLTVASGSALAELRDFPVRSSQTYELKLEDTEGRANKVPAQFIVEAVPNRRPELKVETPKGDQRVSPIEEVAFRANAWDDFGMARYGLSYTVAGHEKKEIELGRETRPDERQQFTHLLKLEELDAKPDDLISWNLWAEDTGPDGQPRRTTTDLYFAEVRPFEEVYRQGEDEEGESAGDGGQTEKLAELEKQIISATWNLGRSAEADGKAQPDAKYLKDEPVVRDSQAEALTQAKALRDKAVNAKEKAVVETAAGEMQTALDRLGEAAKGPAPLPRALDAEESAYHTLLKLAAHQFNVQRQKGRPGKMAQQRNQEQLEQLDLKEDQKRYETKREAEPKQNEQQREQLAILNRLKELAQRQNDINARVKELQTALQEAKTEKERDEVRRQLKRLREEEQQLLADLDELRQKMEKSPQQAQFAEERHQLDQIRNEAQQSAESMEKNAASQALASGTRAARELDQMRDEFRKKTSRQFTDEMREMRSDARAIAERQQEIAESLKAASAKPERPTLEDSSEREKLAGQFEKQQTELQKVTESMKQVSEQAEAAEPLLARELYDALRKTTQADTRGTLEKTQELAQRGNQQQAQKFEEKAHREIDELKTGVERAAESVLGDEAEALRQARAELDTLGQELNREIAQARPDLAPREEAGSPSAARKEKPDAQSGSTAPGQPPGKSAESKPAQSGDSPSESASREGKQAEKSQGQTGKGSKDGAGGTPQQPGSRAKSATAAGGTPTGSPGADTGQATGARQRRMAGAGGGASGSASGGNFDGGPLTGERFVEWSDRLRNVEEMLDEPALRNEVARVREVAKGVRAEFKQTFAQPDWDLVHSRIGLPLAELRNRVTEELARRESKENLVPIDRDPVPTKYAERVRRYYEELGRSH